MLFPYILSIIVPPLVKYSIKNFHTIQKVWPFVLNNVVSLVSLLLSKVECYRFRLELAKRAISSDVESGRGAEDIIIRHLRGHKYNQKVQMCPGGPRFLLSLFFILTSSSSTSLSSRLAVSTTNSTLSPLSMHTPRHWQQVLQRQQLPCK